MTSIRVIIFNDGRHWIAQCLEYDIAAQADDLDTVRSRLLVAVEAEAETSLELMGERFKGIAPAPRAYQEMWERKASRFRNTSSVHGDGGVTVELALAA